MNDKPVLGCATSDSFMELQDASFETSLTCFPWRESEGSALNNINATPRLYEWYNAGAVLPCGERFT